MSKNITSSYVPGTVPTVDNWPENLRMPPLRRQEKKPKPIVKPSSESEGSEEVVLWSFDYPHGD